MNLHTHRTPSLPATALRLVVFLTIVLTQATKGTAQVNAVSMKMEAWTSTGRVTFEQRNGRDVIVMLPGNLAQGIPGSKAVLKDVHFRNGTIEYDVEASAGMGAGIGFRQRDDDNFELFYLRPQPNCDHAPDCVQYAPQVKGALLWDVFPQYQNAAPLHDGWNHIKMVIAGMRMNVFFNREVKPSMQIGRLEGSDTDGTVMLMGPGVFSNLVLTPGATDGLSTKPLADPTAKDPRYIRHWQLSPYSPIAKDVTTPIPPPADTSWKPLSAERAGFVNVSREYGLILPRSQSNIVWLKTTLGSASNQDKRVEFGWVREAWVYVNGKLIYADKNLFQPAAARKSPDGRMSLQNGVFTLPLKTGENEIVVGLVNNFYGWGLTMRLHDLKGIL